MTLAVLGDSTAAGFGDPMGGGRYRGFGPLLARAVSVQRHVQLVNTGRSGARVGCVRREQVPLAVAARPDLAVVLVGVNDTLRSDFDPALLYEDLTAIVTALSANGATVVTARYHQHGRVFPLPRVLARALDARIDALNDAIDRVVREQGLRCLDLAALPACYEASTWSIDRLHPSQRGHRLLARGFADLLALAGHPVGWPDDLDRSDGSVPNRLEEIIWLVRHGIPWLWRRSRDLVPLAVAVALRPVAARQVGTAGGEPRPAEPHDNTGTQSCGGPAWVIGGRRGSTASDGR